MSRVHVGIAVAVVLGIATGASGGQLAVGSGSAVDLGTGSIDLGCADLTVGGTLNAGTAGLTRGRDVTIAPGGVANGESATLQVAGDWDNAGTFNAGTSTVRLVDDCGLLSAVVAGNTTFAGLDVTTSSSKLVSFESGSTQTVTGALALAGEAGARLQVRSTLAGSEATLDVQGTQDVAFVDVQDSHATGAPLLLGPDSAKGSNTLGWLLQLAVPLLSPLGLGLMVAGLAWSGRRALGRRG